MHTASFDEAISINELWLTIINSEFVPMQPLASLPDTEYTTELAGDTTITGPTCPPGVHVYDEALPETVMVTLLPLQIVVLLALMLMVGTGLVYTATVLVATQLPVFPVTV